MWRKSSLCKTDSPICVEVQMVTSHVDGPIVAIDVRDSKENNGPVLSFLPEEWQSFIDGVKAGDFDIT